MSSERSQDSNDPSLAEGLTGVVNAALGVGASMAKALAQASAPDGHVPAPRSDRPLEAIVHYGVVAVSSILSRVVPAPQAGAAAPDTVVAPAAAPASEPELPAVRRGGALRIPLSVENPATEPMHGLAAVCISMVAEQAGGGRALGPGSVRFTPPVLDVAPRDFEKLTVIVQTEPDHAAGTYRMEIGLGTDQVVFRLRFRVLAEAQASAGAAAAP